MRVAKLPPLALSLGVHLVVVAITAASVTWWLPPPPAVLRMHLIDSGGDGLPTSGNEGRSLRPSSGLLPDAGRVSDAAPVAESASWVSATGVLRSPVPAPNPALPPASLSELLGDLAGTDQQEDLPPPAGWARGTQTEGHEPPPLPPAGLIPPQGAQWTVSFVVPAEGGFPLSITGVDQGHQELDAWLQAWLRDAVFPPSVDGQSYRLKWTLVLDVSRPE